MITVTIEKRYGAATVRAKVSASTIEWAVTMAGEGARLVLPIEGETFFAPVTAAGIDFGAMNNEQIEAAVDLGLTDAYDAWLRRLMDEMDLIEDPSEASTPLARLA